MSIKFKEFWWILLSKLMNFNKRDDNDDNEEIKIVLIWWEMLLKFKDRKTNERKEKKSAVSSDVKICTSFHHKKIKLWLKDLSLKTFLNDVKAQSWRMWLNKLCFIVIVNDLHFLSENIFHVISLKVQNTHKLCHISTCKSKALTHTWSTFFFLQRGLMSQPNFIFIAESFSDTNVVSTFCIIILHQEQKTTKLAQISFKLFPEKMLFYILLLFYYSCWLWKFILEHENFARMEIYRFTINNQLLLLLLFFWCCFNMWHKNTKWQFKIRLRNNRFKIMALYWANNAANNVGIINRMKINIRSEIYLMYLHTTLSFHVVSRNNPGLSGFSARHTINFISSSIIGEKLNSDLVILFSISSCGDIKK